MKNNNKKVIVQFAKKQYKAEFKRHMVLIFAAAFAVMTLFSVFSFAYGKLETDMLREARMRGAVSNTKLEDATKEQYEQIKKLHYVKDVGKCIQFGNLSVSTCAVLDDAAWEKIKKPAFTDICGTYPKEKMEIMLPVSVLDAMQIKEPYVGMKVHAGISFFDENAKAGEYDFVLSGYYTEYIDTVRYGLPETYFSKEFLDSVSGTGYPDMTLYIRQNDTMSGIDAENALYRDVETRDVNQQFLGYDTAAGKAFFTLAGGFDTALILAVVILISAGLLIYNVLHISFQSNVRGYGLLKTIGTTKKQLKDIARLQIKKDVLYGSLIGMTAGILIALVLIPALLSRMYLYGFGSAAGMITFHPLFLAASVIFVGIAAYFCSMLAVRRTLKLTPVEAMGYMENIGGVNLRKKSIRKKRHIVSVPYMAWRNILRFKKRFFISAACLSLGFIVSLGIIMISKGVDTKNEIEYDLPDISVITRMNENFYQSYKPCDIFPDSLINRIQAVCENQNCVVERGGFGEIAVENEVFDPVREGMDTSIYFYRMPCTVQIKSDEYLSRLKAFAEEQGLYLDVDPVLNGDGVIFLHDHRLSHEGIEMSKDTIGKTLEIYGENNTKADMRFCGYLDIRQENLPDINNTWMSGNGVFLIVSEKGFGNIPVTKQNFLVNICADADKRAALGREVKKLTEEYNSLYPPDEYGNQDFRTLDIQLKTDILQEMRDYIVSNRLALGALCAVLLLMGIVNYMDVEIAGISIRKKELAVMESIGLTGKQLKRMLILEGVFYSTIITAITGFFGGGILFLAGRIMSKRMDYFVFRYPIAEFIVCAVALFISCAVIVLLLYQWYGKRSVSEKLRMYTD